MIRLAAETGGEAYFIDSPNQLGQIYDCIQLELRAQYLLAYQSTHGAGTAAGKDGKSGARRQEGRRRLPRGGDRGGAARARGEGDERLLPVTARELVLASGSPRRRELLDGLGLVFAVRPAEIDESPCPAKTPRPTSAGWPSPKRGKPPARPENAGALVLAADTVVVVDCELLGKPRDGRRRRANAARSSPVAATTCSPEWPCSTASANGSRWRGPKSRWPPSSDAEIALYVAERRADGQSRAYAVQGRGALRHRHRQATTRNVVGLPPAGRLPPASKPPAAPTRSIPELDRVAEGVEREVGHDLVAVEVEHPQVLAGRRQVGAPPRRRPRRRCARPRRGRPRRR